MLFTKSFFDLCVSPHCFNNNDPQSTLKLLYDYGYRTIAINHEVEDIQDETEDKKKKKKSKSEESKEIIPEPMNIDNTWTEKFEGLTILKRLTIKFGTSDSFYKMVKSANYKKYDILAILPTTMAALSFACVNIDADILSFDSEVKRQYRMNRRTYNTLVNKGYFFEILYSPTIEDKAKLNNTINISHLYHTFGKSKNIIISSGASSQLYIRSPYDVINLGAIFGLNEQQSKNSITHLGSNLCKKAFGRCHGKSVMLVENLDLGITDQSLIEIQDSDGEDVMEVDQPVLKKIKH